MSNTAAIRRLIVLTSAAPVFVLGVRCVTPARLLAVNSSPSAPRGIYVSVAIEPSFGALVEFKAPKSAREYYESIGTTFPRGVFFLKPIVAGPGAVVDTTGRVIIVNGERLAPITTHDSRGNPLPVWRARRVLQDDEFFVLSDRVPNSLDSRHFGPIRRSEIYCVRRPILIWGNEE